MQVLHPSQPEPDRTVSMSLPRTPISNTPPDGSTVLKAGDHHMSWYETYDRYEVGPFEYGSDDEWTIAGPDGRNRVGGGRPRFALLSVFSMIAGLVLVALAAYAVFTTSDQVAASGLVVPSVISQSQTEATGTLNQAGFSVEVEVAESAGGAEAAATVVAQSPSPGDEHDPSLPVILTVSGGDGHSGIVDQSGAFELPVVTGRTRVDAEEALRTVGLIPQIQYVDVDPNSPDIGYAITQTPQPKTIVAPGSEVVILIARAAESTTVPATVAQPPTTVGPASAGAGAAPAVQPAAPHTATTTTSVATSTIEPTTTSVATSTLEPTTAPTVTTPAAEQRSDDARMFLLTLSERWSSGAWGQLSSMMSAEALEVARQHYEADARLLIDATSVDVTLNSCSTLESGTTACEILYGSEGQTARIFNVEFSQTADGFTVSAVTFAGDAG